MGIFFEMICLELSLILNVKVDFWVVLEVLVLGLIRMYVWIYLVFNLFMDFFVNFNLEVFLVVGRGLFIRENFLNMGLS